MEDGYCEFKMREIIDMTLGISLPDFLYGKLSENMCLSLTQDILNLKIEFWDENDYSKWQAVMEKRCSYLNHLLQEFQCLRMTVAKKRFNTDDRKDHIDG